MMPDDGWGWNASIMTLRSKTLVAFGLVFLLAFGAVYGLAHALILRGFTHLERSDAVAAMARAETAVQSVIDELDGYARDWAWWDSTYRYMQDRNAEFAASTLVDGSWSSIHINAMALVGESGEVVFGTGFDLANRKATALPDAVRGALAPGGPLCQPRGHDQGVHGILMTAGGPMLVASRAILPSDLNGPARGVLAMGRYLGDAETASIGRLSGLSLRFERLGLDAPSAELRRLEEVSTPDGAVYVGALDNDTLRGARVLKDVRGRPVLVMMADMPRDIHREALFTLRFLEAAIAVVGILFFVVFIGLQGRIVLSRVSHLKADLDRIRTEADPAQRVGLEGHDELTRLAAGINGMLASITRTRDALERSNRALRVLSDSNQILIRATNEQTLLQDICRVVIEVGQYPCAWVGMAEGGAKSALTCVAHAGCRDEVLDLAMTDSGAPESNPATAALHACKAKVWRRGEPASASWVEAAGRAGIELVLAEPVTSQGSAMGVQVVGWPASAVLGDEEITLFSELASDVAYGLIVLRTGERLRQAQKMEAVGRLAGGIAHDFNNLLTSIVGFARLIRDSQPAGSTAREDADEILKAGERAAALTKRMLALGRKQMVQMGPVDLNAVVRDMDKLLRRTLGEDVELVTVLDPGHVCVNSDVGLIEQVILNLAVNARDAMSSGGTLTIRTEPASPDRVGGGSSPMMLLAVRDTGTGMSRDVRERAFEPFFTTRRDGERTGLGLSTVYSITEQCGGHVEIESELGKGSEIRVYLPVCGEGGEPEGAPTPHILPGGNERILVVEDEETVRRLTVRLLKSIGYRVQEVRNGSEALRLCEQEAPALPDLILTDVVMPHMGGPELVAELGRRGYRSKVVYMTGFSQDRVIQEAIAGDHSAPVLLKPYNYEELALLVRQVLDSPAS